MANKLMQSIILSTVIALSTTSIAYADFRGEVSKDSVKLSASDIAKGLARQSIENDSVYAPVQHYLPKPTHYYATTLACNPGCQPQGCTYNERPGVLHQILSKPIDQEEPDGTGTTIDSKNTKTLNQWDRGGFYCDAILPDAKGAVLAQALNFQAKDLQEHGLLAAKVNGPKDNGLTLIKYNTNIWAEPKEQTVSTQVLGVPVKARATPKEYVFDYGDGTPLQTRSVPGHFLRDDEWDVETDTTHVYEQTGTYAANVMTIYEAEFSVNGGEWLPMIGRAEVWGDPVPVDVWRTNTFVIDPRTVKRGN